MVGRGRLVLCLCGMLVGRARVLGLVIFGCWMCPKSTNHSQSRIWQPRRPNSISPSPSPFATDRAHHQSSHSDSAVNTPSYSESKDDVTITGTTFTPQSSQLSAAAHPAQLPFRLSTDLVHLTLHPTISLLPQITHHYLEALLLQRPNASRTF